jgi:hypothetical protein
MRRTTDQAVAAERLLVRAARARRIAGLLSLKDAAVLEDYARECEALAWRSECPTQAGPLAA